MGNWDKPWMIGGGVEHSVESARLVAHVASRAQEGVLTPTDLLVRALEAPGPGVRINPGAAAMLNRAGGLIIPGQSYLARLPVQDTVQIAPTGATARTDMIIARIKDPFQAGTPFNPPSEADLQTTDYVETFVVSNVGTATDAAALNLGYPAITLATVQMPANSTNVIQSWVTDRRRLYSAQTSIDKAVVRAGTRRDLTATAYGLWPLDLPALTAFTVPWWANYASVSVILGNVGMGAQGNNGGAGWTATGNLRFALRVGGTDTAYSPLGSFSLDSDTGIDRSVLVVGAPRIAIPASFKGKTAQLRLEAARGSGNAPVIWDARCVALIDVAWLQEASS